jgi:hypothetical protein
MIINCRRLKQIVRSVFWLILSFIVIGLVACGDPPPLPDNNGGSDPQPKIISDTSGGVTIKGDVWADNWFAFYLGDKLLVEDSVPIATERSFNAETFTFKADYPLILNFVVKDFKEND